MKPQQAATSTTRPSTRSAVQKQQQQQPQQQPAQVKAEPQAAAVPPPAPAAAAAPAAPVPWPPQAAALQAAPPPAAAPQKAAPPAAAPQEAAPPAAAPQEEAPPAAAPQEAAPPAAAPQEEAPPAAAGAPVALPASQLSRPPSSIGPPRPPLNGAHPGVPPPNKGLTGPLPGSVVAVGPPKGAPPNSTANGPLAAGGGGVLAGPLPAAMRPPGMLLAPRPGMPHGMRSSVPIIFPQPGNAAMFMRPGMMQQLRPGIRPPMLMPLPGTAAGGTGGPVPGNVAASLPGGMPMPRPMPMPLPIAAASAPPPAAGVPSPAGMPVPHAPATMAAAAAGAGAARGPTGTAAQRPAPPSAGAAAAAATATAAAAGGGMDADGKTRAPGGSISQDDIQMVQNLIERCLQLYMTQNEVVSILQQQAKIEPGFTQLVWHKLEEQNPEFFRCYYTRLKLKSQIIMFNHLLEQQVAMVQKVQRGWDSVGGSSDQQQFASVPQFVSTTAGGIPLFQTSGSGGGGPQASGGLGKGPPAAAPTAPGGGKGPAGSGQQQQRRQQQQQLDEGRPPESGGPSGSGRGPGCGTASSSHGHLGFPSELAHHGHSDDHSHGASPLMRIGSESDLHKSLLQDMSPLHGSAELAMLPRNFSLSDLALEHLHGEGPADIQHDFNLGVAAATAPSTSGT